MISIQTLVGTAEDMNKVMGLEPEIKTEEVTEEELTERIKAEAADVVAKDKLDDSTWAILEELGVAEKAIAARKKGDEKPTKAAPAKKGSGKKADGKKPAAKPAAKGKTPAAKKAPAKPKEPRFTRDMAFAQAVKSGVKDEGKLLEKADSIYAKHTKTELNPKEAKWTHNKAIGLLKALGLVEVEDGKVNVKF